MLEAETRTSSGPEVDFSRMGGVQVLLINCAVAHKSGHLVPIEIKILP